LSEPIKVKKCLLGYQIELLLGDDVP